MARIAELYEDDLVSLTRGKLIKKIRATFYHLYLLCIYNIIDVNELNFS
jgi:hypothetical protein